MVAKQANKKNAGKPGVLKILIKMLLQSYRQSEFCTNSMYHESDPARRVPPPWNVYVAKFDLGREG